MSGPDDTAPATAGGDIIADLVHQFSDPFAFYRELIQNSIDAGSTRIEVTLRHQPGTPKGLTTARVADWGEGMDRNVIERYLLTKFRSSKEDDLTKIGKFGIGFLSVFAPAPDAVVVDTGRNGEDWRLIFHPDLSYELLRAEQPCEGTAVTLHKAATASEYEAFAARSEEAVRRWCRHSEADVTFAAGASDGSPPPPAEPVREPFAADAPYQVEHRDPHTLIVAGYARREPPPVGFYNRGLTLLEAHEALVPGVAFKAVSNHLEHTLTRDNVRRDRHFERIVAQVRSLADGPLLERLPEALAEAARRPEPGDDYACLLGHAEPLFAAGRLAADRIWFPTWAGAAHGAELRRSLERWQTVLWAQARGPVAAALEAAGTPVLRAPAEHPAPLLGAARRISGAGVLRPAEQAFGLALAPGGAARADTGTSDRALSGALGRLLAQLGPRAPRAAVAELHGAGSDRPWALFSALGVPEPAAACLRPPLRGDAGRLLCLNAAHPRVAAARSLAARAPRLAALLLARLLAVPAQALPEEADHRLTAAALAGPGP